MQCRLFEEVYCKSKGRNIFSTKIDTLPKTTCYPCTASIDVHVKKDIEGPEGPKLIGYFQIVLRISITQILQACVCCFHLGHGKR